MTDFRDGSLALLPAALGKLMPLHLVVDGSGVIVGHGPTLAKLAQDRDLTGCRFFDLFELRRPAGIADMAGLLAHAGQKLRLSLRNGPGALPLRGLAQELAGGAGCLINLSFGIGVMDAVRVHALTDADFAPTDLAVEMMYLIEAKAATLRALHGLAERLEGDKRQAEAQALTDTLTGLRNRRALSQVLDALSRGRTPFALMHLDLDYFKTVNDTLGHAAGDHVLCVVAEILRRETRSEDTVARIGGDEFVLVFPGLNKPAQLEAVGRRIIDELSRPIDFEGKPCRISGSIGIVLSTQYESPDAERMQSDADEALYASKRAGRGRAFLHRPPRTQRRRA